MIENRLETKKEISNVHFLVHPGWIMKDNFFARNHPGVVKLMNSYVEKATTLKPGELMVIFAPTIDDRFVRDFKKQKVPALYVTAVRKIKEILGDRAIVLADSDEDADAHRGATFKANQEKVWNKIKTIAEKRGLHFSKNLTAEAYGEKMVACVRLIAKFMHEAAGMAKADPVQLRASLTDYPMLLDPVSRQLAQMREQFPRENIHLSENTRIDFSGV